MWVGVITTGPVFPFIASVALAGIIQNVSLFPPPPPFSFLLPTVKNVKYPLAFSYYRQEKAIPSVGFVLLFLIVIATENGWAYSPRQGEWRHLYNF